MERIAYNYLAQGEYSWWYRARRRFALRALRRSTKTYSRALDFGAGFGACYSLLHTLSPSVDAFEIDAEAAEGCKTRGYRKVSSQWNDFTNKTYDLVGAFDVIEHIENDVVALQAIRKQMRLGGTLVLSVPAFQFMWSEHDVDHHHFRRYTVATISRALESAGFEVRYATYWNCILFPVAYMMRLIGRGGGESLAPSKPVNATLNMILWLESRMVPHIRLTWGTGIIVVAEPK